MRKVTKEGRIFLTSKLLKNPPVFTKINDLRSAWLAAAGFGLVACRREADSRLRIVALEFGLATPDFAAASMAFWLIDGHGDTFDFGRKTYGNVLVGSGWKVAG